MELQQKQIEKLQKENTLLNQELAKVISELRKYKNENTPTSSVPYYEKENTNHRDKQSGQKEGHTGISRRKPNKIHRKENVKS